MEWIVSKQIAVEAETPEEAVAKIDTGKTISFNVTLRPPKPSQPQLPTQVMRPTPQASG